MFIIGKEDKAELELYKELTTGIIVQSTFVKPRKRPRVWSIKAEYYVNNKRYFTSSKEDRDQLFEKGDSVK